MESVREDISIQLIHLTIMRNTKGGNTEIRCYIVRLA
eukprot:COSAG01_NODE_962_length_12418_cov_57.124492_10_plen_37_part_00